MRTGKRLSRVASRTAAALATAAAALALAAPAEAKFIPAPGSPYAVGDEPYSVYAGRFNADLLTDLATVNGTSGDVNVFDQAPGDGGFTGGPGSPFAVNGGPSFGAVRDFNGDGRQDIAVAQFIAPQNVVVMLQQPNGTLAAESPSIPVGDAASAIGAGDFNGDGKFDFAVASWNAGTVQIFLRKPDNTGFTAGASIATGGTHPRYIAVGDLDGANGPDLAVTNFDGNNVSVLLNQAGGGLAQAPGSPYTVGHSPQVATIARLNGDDKPDIAIANEADGNVTVLDRQPGGNFAPQQGSPFAVGNAPVGIAAADFRGVGRNDLAVAVRGANVVAILENDGTTFARGADVPTAPATSPYGVTTGQFNEGDTLPDLAVTGIGGTGGAGDPDRLSVFINQPPPTATTLDATDVTGAGATLNASVNPRGSDSDAHFEYGTTEAYGSVAPAGGELPAGADRSDHAISRAIDGLAPGTTYHYRVVASNAAGSYAGADRTFSTAATPPPPSTLGGPPQAYLSAPAEVAVGTKAVLSAEGSTPVGGLTYRFDLDGSGNFATNLGKDRSVEATFTTPGDVKVGLQVTDSIGRTDTVRRTVHVTSPPVYGLSVTPRNPDPGDKVRFTLRQVVDDATKPAGERIVPLPRGTLSTITYGDGSKLRGTAGALQIPGRDASSDGSFTHTFDRRGAFQLHVNVDDLNGFQQGVDLLLRVGRSTDYAPAISTPTTTVEQGTCVTFKNATAPQLSVDNAGPVQDQDINPVHQLIIVAPEKKFTTFGGGPKFDDQPVNLTTLQSSTVIAGSPFAHFQYTNVADLSLPSFNFHRATAKPLARQDEAEPTQPADPVKTCQQFTDLESALAAVTKPPYPPGAGAGWPTVKACPAPPRTTYSTDTIPPVTPVLKHIQTTRHTWFSINRWDFGDGTKSGPSAYLPSYEVYHPYVNPGNFTVKLSTTFPDDLAGQLDEWNRSCASHPLDPTKDDNRLVTRSTELKLHVRAHFERIRSRGLWMTTAADYFEETDLPDVYSTTGAVFINTRRASGAFDPRTGLYNNPDNVADANGVLMVVPDSGPLMVAPKSGEIIGAAHLWWQSNGQQIALGPMPTSVRGTPGLVLPESSGGVHDFGVFTDPPAVLGAGAPPPTRPGDPPQGSPPPPGAAFHVNSAHVVLREKSGGAPGGGSLELNVHLPPPLGPNGAGSDETVVRNVSGNGKLVAGSRDRRGLLDNVDVDIPAVELVPGIVSFDGGKLSHHVGQTPPWQATGGLTVFGKKVSMSPDSKKQNCPVRGGLGFEEGGSLYNAGAVLDGLEIPLPNPPAPNPITALANPAFEILPATPDRPLDMFGCLSLRDYPSHDTFTVTGCVSFLSAGAGGVSIPKGEQIPLCPNELGGELFALTDQNSTPDPGRAGRRVLRGIVVRASGGLGLGPKQFPVANAYLEYRNTGDTSTVEAKGHVGLDIIKDHLSISGDIFGRFRTLKDWDIGGEGGVTQDIICVPFTDLCPAPGGALLIAYKGVGVCARAYGGIGVGGSVTFSDLALHPHVPGCDLDDLRQDLGVPGRILPRYDDVLLRANAPPLAFGAAQSTAVQMKGGSPYSVIVVNGSGASPIVQVRDPSGRIVIDDNGQPVQGLTKAPGPPAPVDLASETPPPARPLPVAAQQGLLHNDLSNYHDANVDLRHTTLIQIRAPKKGRYTITTKDGSSPITAISHADAFATPRVHTGVIRKKGRKRMLTLQSKLPSGTTMTVAEEGRGLSHRIASLTAAKGSAFGDATAARVNKHVQFRPALGDGGKRKLVAVISRDGIPQQRLVIGSYRAPSPPKTGRIRGLRVKRHGNGLTITWRRAANAVRYLVTVKLGKRASTTRSVGAKAHRLVLREALARKGATVTVRAIGPLSVSGKPATRRLGPAKVKRLRHFVL